MAVKGAHSARSEAGVALLRGVNVGGKNRLPMAPLAAMFEAAGCRNVRTYIQSGNVVFEAAPRGLAARIEAAILKDFGFAAPVTLRTRGEFEAVVRGNPFLPGADESHLYVGFLAGVPAPQAVKKLDPRRSPPDRFQVIGREVYLLLPNGVGRSKLTNAWFDRALETVCTIRNWRTVKQLLAMCGE